MATETSWTVAYESLRDQLALTDDAIGAFALQLRFNLDDLGEIAAESIVGGGDDKKCDVFYFDLENGIVVLAQCYRAKDETKPEAPANKASDLNTAVGWILNADLEKIPEPLRDRSAELRNALTSGQVRQLHVWYVHNLPQSQNVKNELETVAKTTAAGLTQYASHTPVDVFVEEVGTNEIQKLYVQAERAIIVTDDFQLPLDEYYESAGPGWAAISTTVPGKWLAEQFENYKTDLFSANIRGYLGSRDVDANINNGIKNTAKDEPENFSIFNNGITALVIDFTHDMSEEGKNTLNITGLSIVNGAQTTGSLANSGVALDEKLLVPIRFIKSQNEELVDKIVKYNNSQNKIEAADFRSGDSIQQRLREEFEAVPDAEYEGGRRGGASDAIKRNKNTIPSYTVAQAMAAFHGDPVIAYDRKSELWKNEKYYGNVFHDKTSARHMVMVYSLLLNLNNRRLSLVSKQKKEPESLTDVEKKTLSFLNKKGSQFLLLDAISRIFETIIGKSIPNKFSLQFKENLSPAEAAKNWDSLLDIVIPLNDFFSEAFSNGRIQGEGIVSAMPKFVGIFDGLKTVHAEAFQAFADKIET